MGNICACASAQEKFTELDIDPRVEQVNKEPLYEAPMEESKYKDAKGEDVTGEEPEVERVETGAAEAYKSAEETKDQSQAPLVVVFEYKGVKQAVEFTSAAELGFDYVQQAACCGGKAPVKVKKIAAALQAANKGVALGAVIRSVNGEIISDADQLRDVLSSAVLLGKPAPKADVAPTGPDAEEAPKPEPESKTDGTQPPGEDAPKEAPPADVVPAAAAAETAEPAAERATDNTEPAAEVAPATAAVPAPEPTPEATPAPAAEYASATVETPPAAPVESAPAAEYVSAPVAATEATETAN